MSENRPIDVETLSGQIRRVITPEKLDVEATGDKLGIFTHANKETANQLREFFPTLLGSLMDLEGEVDSGLNFPDILAQGEVVRPKVRAEQEFAKLRKLVTAVARVLYYPEATSESESSWHLETYGKSYQASSEILAYPPRGSKPKHFSLATYDFQRPAIMRFVNKDMVSNEKLIMEFFPVRYATYPPPFTFLNGVTPATAEAVLTQSGKNPATIRSLITTAEEKAVNPHMVIRLEGAQGRPISQVTGELAQRNVGGRNEVGFDLHLKSVGYENQPADPKVMALERRGIFLPLPPMKKDPNVPMASLARAVLGMGLKQEYQAKNFSAMARSTK